MTSLKMIYEIVGDEIIVMKSGVLSEELCVCVLNCTRTRESLAYFIFLKTKRKSKLTQVGAQKCVTPQCMAVRHHTYLILQTV